MKEAMQKTYSLKLWTLVLGIVILLGALSYSVYRYMQEVNAKEELQAEYEAKVEELDQTRIVLQNTERDKMELASRLSDEQDRNDEFFNQIEELEDTVGVLDKLSKTDKELLQKYSKVYFLNEHYIPEKLRDISDDYIYGDKELQIHSKVWPFLRDLLEDAEDDDIDLKVLSAYRSFGEQASVKNGYVFTYGSGANTFSADQGYSEHQLGTTVDFVTSANPTLTIAFENTEAFKWLEKNAYKYGFTLSYPKGNVYYQYEPWHWRFVGEKLARDLNREESYFYDWDQRKIDEYLIDIFD